MNAEGPLSPDEAMREVGRVDRRVRDASRGAIQLFLAMGAASVVYWMAVFLNGGLVFYVAGSFWIALTVGLWIFWARLAVHERRLMRINRQMTWSWVAATLITFVVGAVLVPEEPAGGWVVLIMVLAVVAGAPPLYAAWRLRERP